MKKNTKRRCPVCKSKFVPSTLKSGKYGYSNCKKCNLFVLNQTRKVKRNIYTNEYYFRDSNVWYSKYGDVLTRYANHLKKKLIQKYLHYKKRPRLLDVGCGDCNFLQSLNKTSLDLYGIDLNPRPIVKKMKLFEGDFLKHKFNVKFDIITLWHVIEHLDNPKKLLNKVYNNLSSNCLFIVSTPSTNSFGFRLGGQSWFHLDAPFHITLYDNNNLRMLLERSGYTIITQRSFFFEFPTDLLKSLTGIKRLIVLPFYPFIKLFDKETVIFVCRKT